MIKKFNLNDFVILTEFCSNAKFGLFLFELQL